MPFYLFFRHISETVRATSPHISRKVEHKEHFEKNTQVWWDLTVFTAFCDVSSTMDVYEAISTHRDGWGAKIMSHHRRCVGNQVQCDSILMNTMHNNLHYRKVVQNPAWQILYYTSNVWSELWKSGPNYTYQLLLDWIPGCSLMSQLFLKLDNHICRTARLCYSWWWLCW